MSARGALNIEQRLFQVVVTTFVNIAGTNTSFRLTIPRSSALFALIDVSEANRS